MNFEKLNLNRDDILYFLNCGYFANYENKGYSIDFNNIDKKQMGIEHEQYKSELGLRTYTQEVQNSKYEYR